MKSLIRILAFGILALAVATFVAQWYFAARDFATLNRHGRVTWSPAESVLGITGSALYPITPVESYTLFEPPSNPEVFAKALGRIDKLERLMVFSHGQVDRVVWEALGDITVLNVLDLNYGSVDDAAFESLERVSKVEMLIVRDSAVTEKGIQNLSRFESLNNLTIRSNIPGPGLIDQLQDLPRLKTFYLFTPPSPAVDRAIEALMQKRPSLEVDWERATDSD